MVIDPIYEGPGDATSDEEKMGSPGKKYEQADRRVLARFIALDPDWHGRALAENIKLFHQKVRKCLV